jgi:hypothetical protein
MAIAKTVSPAADEFELKLQQQQLTRRHCAIDMSGS